MQHMIKDYWEKHLIGIEKLFVVVSLFSLVFCLTDDALTIQLGLEEGQSMTY